MKKLYIPLIIFLLLTACNTFETKPNIYIEDQYLNVKIPGSFYNTCSTPRLYEKVDGVEEKYRRINNLLPNGNFILDGEYHQKPLCEVNECIQLDKHFQFLLAEYELIEQEFEENNEDANQASDVAENENVNEGAQNNEFIEENENDKMINQGDVNAVNKKTDEDSETNEVEDVTPPLEFKTTNLSNDFIIQFEYYKDYKCKEEVIFSEEFNFPN